MTSSGDTTPPRPDDADPQGVDKVEPDLTNVFGKPLHLSRISDAMSKARKDARSRPREDAPPRVTEAPKPRAEPLPTPHSVRTPPRSAPQVPVQSAPIPPRPESGRATPRITPLMIAVSAVGVLMVGTWLAYIALRPGSDAELVADIATPPQVDAPVRDRGLDTVEADPADTSPQASGTTESPGPAPVAEQPMTAPVPPLLLSAVTVPDIPSSPVNSAPPEQPPTGSTLPEQAPIPKVPPTAEPVGPPSSLEPEVPAVGGEPQAPSFTEGARVLVHYAQGLDRPALETLLRDLNGSGLETGTPVPVGFTISATNIRYYHESDRQAAGWLQASLGGADLVSLRDFTTYRPRPSVGLIELWIADSFAAPEAPPSQ